MKRKREIWRKRNKRCRQRKKTKIFHTNIRKIEISRTVRELVNDKERVMQ